MISYAQQLLEEGRTEGRAEGEKRGQVKTIEGMLRIGIKWDVIEAATGLNEALFRALKQEVSRPDGPTLPRSR